MALRAYFPTIVAAILLSQGAMLAAEAQRDWAFLGINTEPVKPGGGAGGLRVTYVFPDSAAENIGLQRGDVIIALDNLLMDGTDTLIARLRRLRINATVRFLVERDGKRMPISGKVGSYQKTMEAIRKRLLERLEGKRAPKLPSLKWWSEKDARWLDGPQKEKLQFLDGKLSVIFAFDDCETCQTHRYQKFVTMQQAFRSAQDDPPVAFLGIYSASAQEKEEGADGMLQHAAKLFTTRPPGFPVAAAYELNAAENVETRDESIFISNHGLVILDPEGALQYLQIVGTPRDEFAFKYHQLLQKHVLKKPAGEK